MAVMISEEKFGPKAQSINSVAERLAELNWYGKAGVQEKEAEQTLEQFMEALNVKEYQIKWISKDEVADTIPELSFDQSQLWEVLRDLPDQLKAKVDEAGQAELLEKTVDTLPEAIFHVAFDKAFEVFGDQKQVINFLVGHAMYIAVMASTAELAGESKLFEPLLELLESGHVPLGPEGNTIYLI